MSSTETQGRTPLAPELVRDFEAILEQRLAQERRKRRAAERFGKLTLGIAVAALLATAVLAYTLFDRRGPGIAAGVVRTGELRLLDNDGRVRGRWAALPEGGTRLSFLDAAGVERIRMTLFDNGAQGITLADARGAGRVVLSLEGVEGSRLTFADAAGRPRTLIGLSSRDAGTLLFADDNGTPRAALGLDADGRAEFLLADDRRSRDTADVRSERP